MDPELPPAVLATYFEEWAERVERDEAEAAAIKARRG
jgi:hypothetical protein